MGQLREGLSAVGRCVRLPAHQQNRQGIKDEHQSEINPWRASPEPANSFQARTPQSAATIGADWPIAYEIACPVSFPAVRLKTVPRPQMQPPKIQAGDQRADR